MGEVEIGAVVERLAAQGGLDDARFARQYSDDKRELAGWGPDRIRASLIERGVASEHVEAALEGEDQLAQIERATGLLTARSEPPTDDAERTSALAFLARRGFDSEVAYEAVRRHRRAA